MAFATIGWRYYVVYAVIGVFVAGMVVMFFPETRWRGIKKTDGLFGEAGRWWEANAYAKKMGRRDVGVEKDRVEMDHGSLWLYSINCLHSLLSPESPPRRTKTLELTQLMQGVNDHPQDVHDRRLVLANGPNYWRGL